MDIKGALDQICEKNCEKKLSFNAKERLQQGGNVCLEWLFAQDRMTNPKWMLLIILSGLDFHNLFELYGRPIENYLPGIYPLLKPDWPTEDYPPVPLFLNALSGLRLCVSDAHSDP